MNYTSSQSYHTLTHWQSGKKKKTEKKSLLASNGLVSGLFIDGKLWIFPYRMYFEGSRQVVETTGYPERQIWGTAFTAENDYKPEESITISNGTNTLYASYMQFDDVTPTIGTVPHGTVSGNHRYYKLDESRTWTGEYTDLTLGVDYVGPVLIPTFQRFVLAVALDNSSIPEYIQAEGDSITEDFVINGNTNDGKAMSLTNTVLRNFAGLTSKIQPVAEAPDGAKIAVDLSGGSITGSSSQIEIYPGTIRNDYLSSTRAEIRPLNNTGIITNFNNYTEAATADAMCSFITYNNNKGYSNVSSDVKFSAAAGLAYNEDTGIYQAAPYRTQVNISSGSLLQYPPYTFIDGLQLFFFHILRLKSIEKGDENFAFYS